MLNIGRKIVVCGHLCLDLLPDMAHVPLRSLAAPGHLFEVGGLQISTGGCVANTGLALHKLGAHVELMAKVGDDAIGQMTLQFIHNVHPSLVSRIRIQDGMSSSYTVVLAPEQADRIFLHCTGPNAHYGIRDIDFEAVHSGDIFHFGYPPILPRMYMDGGRELSSIMQLAKQAGAITSMDTSLPDSNAASGRADWNSILERVLPYVDVFVPSFEEILFMLRPQQYERWKRGDREFFTQTYLCELAGSLLEMGAAVAGLKLGESGVLLMGGHAERLNQLPQDFLRSELWSGEVIYHPAFAVKVEGTTGAGDSAFAGLLFALTNHFTPYQCAQAMCAVGASNVEAPDAVSSIRLWDAIYKRIESGWGTHESLPI